MCLDQTEFGKLKGRMAKAYKDEDEVAIAKAWEDYYYMTIDIENPPNPMPSYNPKKYLRAFG